MQICIILFIDKSFISWSEFFIWEWLELYPSIREIICLFFTVKAKYRSYMCQILYRSHSSSDEGEQYAALIEYRTSDNLETMVTGSTTTSTTNTNSTITASTAVSTSASTPAPAPRIRQPRPQLTLREQQVMQLRKEMSHPAGVRFKLGRRDCKDGIAFVDCFGAVWLVR